MPNWVTINMTVKGKPEQVKKFVETNQTVEKELNLDGTPRLDKDGNQLTYNQKLTFKAAVPPQYTNPKYRKYPDDKRGLGISAEDPRVEPDGRTSYFDWWNFNIENWGTKWDACDVEVDTSDPEEACYTFQTAWDFPKPWFEAVAAKWIDLEFKVYASEESHEFYLSGTAQNGVADLNFQDYDDVFPTPKGEDFVNLVKEQMESLDLNPDDYDLTNLDDADEINAAIYISINEDLVNPADSDYDVMMEDEEGFKAALKKYKKQQDPEPEPEQN